MSRGFMSGKAATTLQVSGVLLRGIISMLTSQPRCTARNQREKTAAVVELWTAEQFELWVDDVLMEKKPNPYGFIPFVIFPNLRDPKKVWGVSDLTQMMEPLREFTARCHNCHISWNYPVIR